MKKGVVLGVFLYGLTAYSIEHISSAAPAIPVANALTKTTNNPFAQSPSLTTVHTSAFEPQQVANTITRSQQTVSSIQLPITTTQKNNLALMQTASWQQVANNFVQLTQKVQSLFSSNILHTIPMGMQWSVTQAQSLYGQTTGTITVAQESPAAFEQQKQNWGTFLSYLHNSSGTSYSSLLQDFSNIYTDTTHGSTSNGLEQLFTQDSFFLHFIQTTLGACQQCIHDACQNIQKTGYASASARYFFQGDVQAQQPAVLQQIQKFVQTTQTTCTTLFNTLQKQANVDAQQRATLQNNYTALFDHYQSSLAVFLYTLAFSAYQSCAQHASITVPPAQAIITTDIPLDVFDALCVTCQSMVQFLPSGTFKTYSSGKNALQHLQELMGQLHYYAAMVSDNNTAHSIVSAQSSSYSLASLQELLKNTMQSYASAAAYYKAAQNSSLYQVTATRATLYSLLYSYVSTLMSQQNTLTYEQTTEYYNMAYTAALEGGLTELASFFLHNLHNAYGVEIQNFLSAYSQSQMYKDAIKNQNVVDLFYTQNNAVFKGIAVASQTAAQAYTTLLTTAQGTTVSSQQEQQIVDALSFTQNIASLGKVLFLGNGSQTMSADSLLYEQYYDPQSILQGQMLYAKNLFKAQQCDVLLQKKTNPYAPFASLFSTISLTQLLQEHSAYLSLQSAAFALQVVKESTSYQSCNYAALCSLLYAYKVYTFLQQTNWSQYALQNMQAVTKNPQVYTQRIQTLFAAKEPNAYQEACVLAQGLLMTGNQDGYALYQKATQNFAQWFSKNVTGTARIFQAFILYRGLLAAAYQKDTTQQSAYQQALTTVLTSLVSSIQEYVATLENTQSTQSERQSAFDQLQELQNNIHQIMILQSYEQACFNQKLPFLSVTKKQTAQGFSSQITFIGALSCTLSDVSYREARYKELQAQSLQQTITTAEQSYNDAFTLEQLYKQVITLYNQALVLYRSVGMQDAVTRVAQATTDAIAQSLYNAVIVTDAVQTTFPLAVSTQQTAQQITSPASQAATWMSHVATITQHTNAGLITPQANTLVSKVQNPFVSTNTINQQTTKNNTNNTNNTTTANVSTKATKPSYLLRSWSINFTQKQKDIDAVINRSQKLLPAGHTPAPALLAEQKMYQQLITQAQTLIKKQKTGVAVTQEISTLFLQWYQFILQQGGFAGIVLDFDQEVHVLQEQLKIMTTQGVLVNGKTLTTVFELQEQENNGEKNIVLSVSYMPLAAIPRFRGDIFCALYYYQKYQACYAQSITPFVFNGSLYYPSPNQARYADGYNQMIRAYLVALTTYQSYIAAQVTPLQKLSQQERQAASYSQYASLYQQVQQAYMSLFAIFSNMRSLQQSGVKSVFSLQQKQSELYQQAAQITQLFLCGTPDASEYQSVIKKVSAYYFYALLTETNPTAQQNVLQTLLQLNTQAGDMCVQLAQALPQIEGFPSPEPHGFPVMQNIKNNTLVCASQPQYAFPAAQNIRWFYYELAQAYYLQAAQIAQHYTASVDKQVALRAKALMACMYAALQRIALCARNVFTVKTEQQGSDTYYNVTASPTALTILQAGLSYGANTSIQGEQALMSGQQQTSTNNALPQYNILKKMYLDGMIYFAGVEEQGKNIASLLATSSSGVSAATSSTFGSASQKMLNGALSCAAFHQFPSLSLSVTTSKSKTPLIMPLMSISKKLPVDLSAMLTSNWQALLLYADTSINFIEYVTSMLLGTQANEFRQTTATSVQAYNAFVGQITALMRNVYAQIFMPDLFNQQNQTAMQTGIDAALQQEAQQLLVSTQSYIG